MLLSNIFTESGFLWEQGDRKEGTKTSEEKGVHPEEQ